MQIRTSRELNDFLFGSIKYTLGVEHEIYFHSKYNRYNITYDDVNKFLFGQYINKYYTMTTYFQIPLDWRRYIKFPIQITEGEKDG